MDQYPELRDAVLGAGAIQSPTSPLGSFPELARLYQSSFQLPQSSGASGVLAQNTGDVLDEQKRQAAAASSGGGGGGSGGGKYEKYSKPDGGYGFRDPSGNEISVSEYAAATEKDRAEVLKGSKNPIDKAFMKDWRQLDQYIKDKTNAKNDSKARSRAQAVETQVRKLYGIKLHEQTPDSVVNTFMQAYPTIFGKGSTYSEGVTSGFGNTTGKQGNSTLLSAPKKTSGSSGGFSR